MLPTFTIEDLDLESLSKFLHLMDPEKCRTVYVAGPMTEVTEYNYPLFKAVTTTIRLLGYTVICPTEHNLPEDTSWEQYILIGLSNVDRCQTLVLLPFWERSMGARLEREKFEWSWGAGFTHFVQLNPNTAF